MGRRTLLLIAALVVALLGTVLVFLYAQNAEERAQAGQQPVQVLVAKTTIPAGTTGAAASANGAFELTSVPQANVVPGALSDATPLADQLALATVFAGQQIIAPQWGTQGQSAGLVLPAGKIALSVQLGDPERVAGFVSPGSEVVIFTAGTPTVATTGAPAGQATVRTLLAKIQVLAVGPTVVGSKPNPDGSGSGTSANPEQIPTAILTLAVTQDEAQKIIFASGRGGSGFTLLYFGLMGKDSKVVPTQPGTTGANLFP